MNETPSPEWRGAVGKAGAAAFHLDQIYGDLFIAEAWKDPVLQKMAPMEAAAAAVAAERARDDAAVVRLLAEGTLTALSHWRLCYTHEWNWLVMGECDFENDDGDPWLNDLWRERGHEDGAAVARSEYDKVVEAAEKERYRQMRENWTWKPKQAGSLNVVCDD